MILTGKGWYIWRITDIFKGDVQAIVAELQAGEVSHVLIKIADGVYGYNVDTAAELVVALKAAGITPAGWQYVYAVNPQGEAEKAASRLAELGLDAFVIDAEEEYKDKPKAAEAYVSRLNSLFQGEIWLSTYRYIQYHLEFPFREFMAVCNGMMPQVYWLGSHNPVTQLVESIAQWKEWFPDRPYLPTGAAWKQDAWKPTVTDVTNFMDACTAKGLPGVNFWSMYHALKPEMLDVYRAIQDYDFNTVPPPPPPEDPEFLAKLCHPTNPLNLRTGPSTGYPIIFTMSTTTRLYVEKVDRYWLFVHALKGETWYEGWCNTAYVVPA